MDIGLGQYFPEKGPTRSYHPPHGHWEKKEFDLKGHWGGLLSHRPFLLIHLKAEVTGCHLSRDRSRVSLRKPGSVRTYSQCLVTEPWLIFWTSLGNPEISSSGQSPTKPAGAQAISIFRSGFPCWDSSLYLLTSCSPPTNDCFLEGGAILLSCVGWGAAPQNVCSVLLFFPASSISRSKPHLLLWEKWHNTQHDCEEEKLNVKILFLTNILS